MKISDINLDFLWEKRTKILLGAPDPFNEKWRTEKLKFYSFCESAPIPDIVELMVIGYKDIYPRNYWSFVNDKIFNLDPKRDENGIKTFGKEYMPHPNIICYANKTRIAKEEFEYAAEIMLEFDSDYDLATPIERALNGKTYQKTISGNQTVYTVENSPIAQLEITSNSFKLIVNEEHYQYIV